MTSAWKNFSMAENNSSKLCHYFEYLKEIEIKFGLVVQDLKMEFI